MKYNLGFVIVFLIVYIEAHPFLDDNLKNEQRIDSTVVITDSNGAEKLRSNQAEIVSVQLNAHGYDYLGKDPKQATPNPVATVAVGVLAAGVSKIVDAFSGVLKSVNRLNTNFHLNAEAARLAPTTTPLPTSSTPTTPSTPSTTSNSSEITDSEEYVVV